MRHPLSAWDVDAGIWATTRDNFPGLATEADSLLTWNHQFNPKVQPDHLILKALGLEKDEIQNAKLKSEVRRM